MLMKAGRLTQRYKMTTSKCQSAEYSPPIQWWKRYNLKQIFAFWCNLLTLRMILNKYGSFPWTGLIGSSFSLTARQKVCQFYTALLQTSYIFMYTRVKKNPSAWNFVSPKPEVTCGTVAIIIRVVLLSSYLRIRAVSLSSIHYNQSHRVYINRRRQYICLIWN